MLEADLKKGLTEEERPELTKFLQSDVGGKPRREEEEDEDEAKVKR